MASLKGKNATKIAASPKQKIENGEVFGKIGFLREEYDLDDLGVVLAVNDTIDGPFLPAGARVLDAAIKISASLGTGGIIDFGNLASSEGNETADQDSFVQQADAGGSAVLAKMAIGSAALDKKFSESVQTQLKVTEASSNITGIISCWIKYVIN